MWHLAPLRISFILRSVYDLLPSKANLVKWGKSDDPSCPLCNERQTVEHVLSSCKTALAEGRYTWRHNQVLRELAEAVQFNVEKGRYSLAEQGTVFQSEGGRKTWPAAEALPKARRQELLKEASDWECSADLPGWNQYPESIKESGLRPDIVLHSEKAKQFVLIELTVPYESRIEAAHIYKTEKYADLAQSLRNAGFQARVHAIEVGARGFVGASAYDLMKRLSISGRSRTRTLRALAEAAEKSSSWIWTRRNKCALHKTC